MSRLNLMCAVFLFTIACASSLEYGEKISLPAHLLDCRPTADMVDASAKIPAGIKSGNLVELGAFDQCLAIKYKINETATGRGKYCLMSIVNSTDINLNEKVAISSANAFNKSGITVGWCIPEQCPPEKIAEVVSYFLQLADMEVLPILDGMCQTEDTAYSELSASDWGVISFFIIILAVMAISTMYDIYLHFAEKRSPHLLLIAFSVKTNGEKLLTISKNPDQLPCLHGIRFISMMWVVLGHKYYTTMIRPLINLLDALAWAKNDARHMFILNGTVSVDSFFVLSGLLVGYGFCLAKNKGVKFNILMYYLHRYLRLTPVLGAVVLIHATILSHFGSGPYWPFGVFVLKDFCQTYWWAPLVYIQNYYNHDEMCIGQSWYLSVDMQLFLLSPIILIPLWRWPKRTLIASGFLTFMSIVSSFVVTYHFELPGFSLDPVKSQDYMNYYYVGTHVRYGPYLMGIMLGYLLFRLKKNGNHRVRLNPLLVISLWLAAITIMLTVIFASHNILFDYDIVAVSFYNGMHRHAWALALCWVIFACIQGYGGVVNSFLSWPPFQVLGRFTYTIYLTHLTIQFLISASSRTSTYFDDFTAMHSFWGDLFLSLSIAACLTLAFESPMLTIEKVIFGFGVRKQRSAVPTNNGTTEASTSHLEEGIMNKAFVSD